MSDRDAPGTSLSERQMAQELGVSQSSVHRLKTDMEIRTFTRIITPRLTAGARERRGERAELWQILLHSTMSHSLTCSFHVINARELKFDMLIGGRASPVPLHVNLTIQDAESCSEQYKKFPRTLPNGVTKDILCAGDRGKDTCQNDSGGPLLFDARQNLDGTLEREFVLVGVVSGGINCGDTPGIYTRVSSYTDWILETMLEKSQMNKDAV
ncbi:unnamed protein product [Cyprideis torosa]|uniref:Uncharacterized protein n=1 Tax=Cyprideis torosa TaxID=163714 RepID=A0A7R8ZGB4_9CRUS|nr:unnamed protein product [Cyprideis torosa]CAG0879651.1 unnamed protein product [Cyprideis torosa]